jgi:hypothetical protein
MPLNVAEANELLISVRRCAASQMNECIQRGKSKQDQVNGHVAGGEVAEAFKALPALCCFYEQTKAFAYVIECIDKTKRQLPAILSASECPAELVSSVAPLCYLLQTLKWKELDRFVSGFLVKAWKRANVEKLVRPDTVPDIVKHITPRADLSLGEMHGFARAMERELQMDFGWLFAAYPAPVRDVAAGGREQSGPDAPPECVGELPPVRPFSHEDYGQMLGFVAGSLSKWNSWAFEVPD